MIPFEKIVYKKRQNKKTALGFAVFLGESIFTMGYSKNY